MWVSLHAGTPELVSRVLLIWTSSTCYTGLVLFLVRFASAGRRSIEITVGSFASERESGRLCSVPESKIFTGCADSWATSRRRSFTFTTWVRARSYDV